jgi:ferric-dicitrate binding protein FerR (iron transport regulator)
MTMNCAEWEEKLNAYRDGELSDQDGPALEAHLASCADCRRLRDALQAQSEELDALRFDSRALEARIIAAVHAEPVPRLRILLPALAAAAAILVAALLLLPRPAPPAPLMTLQAATGPVEECVGGTWRALPAGVGLRPGSQIRTGDRSKCEISCADGSLLRLDASTEVRIGDPRNVHLQEGEIFLSVAPAPRPFLFGTEQAGLLADQGVFDLSYRRPAEPPSKLDPTTFITSLAVVEGRAKVAQEEVPSPTSCILLKNQAVTHEAADPLLRTRWIHDLLKLKGRSDPEVRRRVTAMVAKLGRTKEPELYEREIRGLGERSVPALLALVIKLPPELSAYDRRGAARLLADLAGPEDVEALIDLACDPDDEVGSSVIRALLRLTGADCRSGDAWKTWYRQNQDVWKAPRK